MKINKNTIISLFAVGLFLLISNQVKALTANAVDRIAPKDIPIIIEKRNAINMDWLRQLRFNSITQRYGTGSDMDLKTEQGIADARYAIWKSDTVQKAYQAYENTMSGKDEEARQLFMSSIEQGLRELAKERLVTGKTDIKMPQMQTEFNGLTFDIDRWVSASIPANIPVINEARNTINMDWLKEIIKNPIMHSGDGMNLTNPKGIKDAADAIWNSQAVQAAYSQYEKTLTGDKAGARERFKGSIERALNELKTTIPTRSSEEGNLTDPDALPTSMRTVRGKPLPPIPGTRSVVPRGTPASEGSLTDPDTLPTSMRTVREPSTSAQSKEEAREEKFRTAREEAARRRAARSKQR